MIELRQEVESNVENHKAQKPKNMSENFIGKLPTRLQSKGLKQNALGEKHKKRSKEETL